MITNYSKMEKVEIKEIKPCGWLKQFLLNQIDGLTGNLEVAGYPFDTVGWDRFDVDTTKLNSSPGWWAYEQTGYIVDGMEVTSELTENEKLKQKVNASFEYTLKNADPDGYLGPKFLKHSDGWNRWPHVVFFRGLLAKYYATKDKSILEALRLHYLGHKQDYNKGRDVINVEIMLLVFLETNDVNLLNLAIKSFDEYNEQCNDDNCAKAQLSNKKAYAHAVTYNEYSKLGALLYICTNDEKYLKPVIKAYKKIDKYHMLPDGLHCSNEFLINNSYRQAHETCNITDFTWSMYYLLMATGKSEYADKIEKCILNAGIGSVDEKFKALQYFSSPNQLVLDTSSNHCDFFMGDKWMSYRPNPGTECCAGNVNRFFPNYCSNLWFKKGNDQIFSVFFGASVFSHNDIQITEVTDYPFSDEIIYSFKMVKPTKLILNIRIPKWSFNNIIYINNESFTFNVKNGFASINREFNDNDIIKVVFSSKLELKECNGGFFFEKGPLVYTYGMYGDRQIDTMEKNSNSDFPAYNIYPNKKWNYALCTSPKDLESIREIRSPMNNNPFEINNAPIKFEVPVRTINNWFLEHKKIVHPVKSLYLRPWKRDKKIGNFVFTPKLPTKVFINKFGYGDKEKITLVPYGAGKVRLTVFNKTND